MRFLTLAVVTIVLASCNAQVGPGEEADSLAAQQSALTGTGPTPYSSWPSGVPLVATNARSAHYVFFEDPTDASRFVAWGFDLVTGRQHFFISGLKRGELNAALTQLEHDINIPRQFDPAFTHGGSGQLTKGPKGPIGPGQPWSAWTSYARNIAVKVEAARLEAF